MRWIVLVFCWGAAALCGLLAPGDWRAVALVPFFAFFGLLAVARPPRGAHADRAGLNRDAPNVPYPASMQLEHDRPAWEAEQETRKLLAVAEAGGYIGGWESGACDPGPKAEIWPAHDDPHWLPALPGQVLEMRGGPLGPLPETPAGAGVESSSSSPAPAEPPTAGIEPPATAEPPTAGIEPPATAAGQDAADYMARQDAGAAMYLDQLAYNLAAHAYRCVATLKGQE